MKPSKNEFYKIDALIELAIDGSITPEQSQHLNDLIVSHAAVRRHYCEYIQLNVNIERLARTIDADCPEYEEVLDQELWDKLAYEEQCAPAVDVGRAKPKRELIQKVVYPPREKRKISRRGIFTLVNVAAVVFLFLLLRFVPPMGGIEVATLTDSLDAKWEDVRRTVQIGSRLSINKAPVYLSEGLIKLDFDNNAKVVLEGPAEFQILAADRIGLNYGTVYVTVPKEAIGFSVYTKHAKIIDLGTEFGVTVDTFGDTCLHVIQGKTAMLVGDNAPLGNMEVGRGIAKKVIAASSRIVDIPFDSRLFVRTFDSGNRIVWKGQSTLSLADIVGGGNGFGTGTRDMGIDPISGKSSRQVEGRRGASNDFRRVLSNPYIDGVFVPDGRSPQMISSEGHIFRDCPETSGLYCQNIIYVTRNLDALLPQTVDDSDVSVRAILMHANMGVTFDLQAMRSLLPRVNIARFQSQFGIRRYALRPDASNADFWILVDGQLRYKKEHVKINELYSVDLELSETARFLTLVITEGDDPAERYFEDRVLTPIDSDWGMFVDPILTLGTQ